MITTKLILPTPSRIFASWPEMNKESKDLSGPSDELPSVEISGPSSPRTPESGESEKRHGLSATLLNQHDVLNSKPPPLEWIVVRIEVTDTGCGIRQKDMAQTKLFCMSFKFLNTCWVCWVLNLFGFAAAFNQTEMGRQQGKRTNVLSQKGSPATYDVVLRWQGNWVGSCTRKADR